MMENTPQNEVAERDTEDGAAATAQHLAASFSAGLDNDHHLIGQSHAHGTQLRPTVNGQPNEEKVSSKLAGRLKDASTDLVDRLFDYLSNCPPHSSDEVTEQSLSPPRHGLTIPASAIGWLSTNLYPDSTQTLPRSERPGEDDDWWMEIPMRDRLPLIKYLLPRATHLRITSEEWPPSLPNKKKDSIDNLLDEAVDQDQSVSFSFHPSGISQEPPTVEEEENEFLNYFYAIRHSPRIDMRLFPNLTVLLIDRVPPEWFKNMNALNDKLELLRVERSCIYNLTSFLFPQEQTGGSGVQHESDSEHSSDADEIEDSDCMLVQDRGRFPKLTHVKLSHCAIGEFSGLSGKHYGYADILHDSIMMPSDTESLTREEDQEDGDSCMASRHAIALPPVSLLTNLESLSLAHNDLVHSSTAFAGLACLPFLSKLDLSFNRLSCMDNVFRMIGNLKILCLSGNRIRSSRGLDRLYSLEQLSLDRNDLWDLADVAGLARLPQLSALDLHSNPLEQRNPKKYRINVLNLFRECRGASIAANATYRDLLQLLPSIDGRTATKRELVALRYLTFHSVGSPGHGSDMIDDENRIEKKNSPQAFNYADVAVKSMNDVEPVSTTGSSNRACRVTRRVRTRKISIDDDTSWRNEAVPIGKACQKNEPTLAIEVDHGRLDPENKAEGEISKMNTISVNFTVKDVISSLSNSSTFPVQLPYLSPEMPFIEENGTFDVVNGFAGEIGDACASQTSMPVKKVDLSVDDMKDEEDSFSDQPFSQCNRSISAADLSLLSISTVKSRDESSGDGPDDAGQSFPGAHASHNDEEKVANGTEKKKGSRDTSLGGCEEVFKVPVTTETPGGYDAERDSEDVIQLDLDSGEDPNCMREAPRPQGNESVTEEVANKTIFPEIQWGDDRSATRALAARSVGDTKVKFSWRSAEETSVYDGPEAYAHLTVLVNLELYFQCFVFPNPNASLQQPWYEKATEDYSSAITLQAMPRIQLCKADRILHQNSHKLDTRESFRHVWSEEVVACGKLAASRLAANRTPRRGFHGDILFAQGKLATVSERRKMIFCSSSAALYIISDYDAVSIQAQKKLNKRQFPLPIPEDALFEDAPWPHAVARHPVTLLHRITIGFGFQRLTLHFGDQVSGTQEFTYVLLTCNKLNTISLLRQLQEHVKDSLPSGITDGLKDSVVIDNDDKQLLDALSVAVAPKVVDVVLHYQVLQQRWKHGDRGTVRRACVVSDSGLFLLDEDYAGDGSTGSYEEINDGTNFGDVSLMLVESAELRQIVEVHAADADPRSITIVIRPQSRLKRTHRWRLLCRDGDGAERLVEDVRKAISTLYSTDK